MRGIGLALAALLLVAGCSNDDRPEGPAADLTPGGPPPTASPPAAALDQLERPILTELADQLSPRGLHVDQLQCSAWSGSVPAELSCTGWFDGVEGTVQVTLSREPDGTVAFDAVLEKGVIATRTIVEELASQGYSSVDCGEHPAYPAAAGSTIFCSVLDEGEQRWVTVTILDEAGTVTFGEPVAP